MGNLHPDLLALAAVAEAYGMGNAAQNLYCLAQYGEQIPPPCSVSDMQCGLSLLGIDSYRLVAPGLQVPDLIQDSIERGHVALAQVAGEAPRKRPYWIVLYLVTAEEWHGLSLGSDWAAFSVSSHLDRSLTGFYVVAAQPLPSWGDSATLGG